jgi:hypothetical protein
MSAFRKFDPYAFLADHEGGGAPSEAAAEAPETLAALATLAGEHSQNENKGSEDEPGIGKSGATPAKAAKIAKADDDGMGTLATFANLAAAHSQNENERAGTTLAKAADAAEKLDPQNYDPCAAEHDVKPLERLFLPRRKPRELRHDGFQVVLYRCEIRARLINLAEHE